MRGTRSEAGSSGITTVGDHELAPPSPGPLPQAWPRSAGAADIMTLARPAPGAGRLRNGPDRRRRSRMVERVGLHGGARASGRKLAKNGNITLKVVRAGLVRNSMAPARGRLMTWLPKQDPGRSGRPLFVNESVQIGGGRGYLFRTRPGPFGPRTETPRGMVDLGLLAGQRPSVARARKAVDNSISRSPSPGTSQAFLQPCSEYLDD